MYRVMIADDEPLVRKALNELMDWENAGCRLVYSAENGDDLLTHIETYTPDIIITDIKMPGSGGIEIAKYIYEKHPHIKVIFLTGYADFSYAKSALTYNVVDYITKAEMFNGIANAIKKAQEKISLEQGGTRYSLLASFYKSVLEGEIQNPAEIEKRAGQLHSETKRFFVLYYTHTDSEDFIARSSVLPWQPEFNIDAYYILSVSQHEFFIVTESSGIAPDADKLFAKIEAAAREYFERPLLIGVCEFCCTAQRLYESGLRARLAYKAGFYNPAKGIQRRNGTRPFAAGDCAPEVQLLTGDVLECIGACNADAAKQTAQAIFSLQEREYIEPDMVKYFTVDFINRCKALLHKKDIAYTSVSVFMQERKTLLEKSDDFQACKRTVIDGIEQAVFLITDNMPHNIDVVKESTEWIKQHYRETISLEKIAAHIGVSAGYLSRVFSLKTGVSLIRYVNSFKIEQAKLLLHNSGMTVTAVSAAVGMENVQYFCKLFKKCTGYTPSEYKRQPHSGGAADGSESAQV